MRNLEESQQCKYLPHTVKSFAARTYYTGIQLQKN